MSSQFRTSPAIVTAAWVVIALVQIVRYFAGQARLTAVSLFVRLVLYVMWLEFRIARCTRLPKVNVHEARKSNDAS